MSEPPVPDHARGKVGMVAMLRRMKGASEGRLAVVHEPAGYLSTLIGSARPVFCWTVHLLGPPVACGDGLTRDLYVPDRCLVPLGSMSDDVMRMLVRAHAEEELHAALADLRTLPHATDVPMKTFARLAELVAERQGIEHALEVVPVASALREIGFHPQHPGGDVLEWVSVSSGIELHFDAGPGLFESWTIATSGRNDRTLVCDERELPPEAPRGQIVQVVLAMWRDASSGQALTPGALRLGDLYARHQRDLEALGTGLPRLRVDGQVFRATRRWLTERHGYMDQSTVVRLDLSDRLLRLEVDSVVYGCPAHGSWLEPRAVLLSDLAAIPSDVLRRRELELEQGEDDLRFNGWSVRSPIEGWGESQC